MGSFRIRKMVEKKLPLTFFIYIYIYIHIYTHIHASIHLYMRTYIYTSIHIYIHAYIYAHIHTYISLNCLGSTSKPLCGPILISRRVCSSWRVFDSAAHPKPSGLADDHKGDPSDLSGVQLGAESEEEKGDQQSRTRHDVMGSFHLRTGKQGFGDLSLVSFLWARPPGRPHSRARKGGWPPTARFSDECTRLLETWFFVKVQKKLTEKAQSDPSQSL